MRLQDWTPEVQVLTLLADRVAEQTAVIVAANSKGGKFKAPKFLPRPMTAVTLARQRRAERRRRQEHTSLMRLLFPNS